MKKSILVILPLLFVLSISVLSCKKPTIQENENGAIENIKAVVAAQTVYYAAQKRYAASFDELTSPKKPYLLGSWNKRSGYLFKMEGKEKTFSVTVVPITPGVTGNRSFFSNQSGVVRGSAKGPADAKSPPLG